MAFDELKENVEDIQENAKAYLESSISYYKLWGFKVAMKSTTMILKFFLISICLMIFLLFIAIVSGNMVEMTSSKNIHHLKHVKAITAEVDLKGDCCKCSVSASYKLKFI